MSETLLSVAQVAELLESVSRSGSSSKNGASDILNGGWLSTEDVAAVIGVDPSTIRRWRTSTPLQGPPFVQLSSRVTVYSIPDVQAWLESRRVVPGKGA
ncbi:helix-turn-helix domain-containing protein [Kitasatospora sp. NPDC051914]|uniref:helix-turn-helix transcriptional regulator n=1 Tax=Kitasatospora sp. NPDC051914 TaxID=3154945 RepID=UPI00341AF6CA